MITKIKIPYQILLLLIAVVVIVGTTIVIAQKYYSEELQAFFSAAKNVEHDSGKTVVAVIGGKEIYQENIDVVRAGNALSDKQAEEYAQENGLTIPKTSAVSDEEILRDLIRQKVIYFQAEQEGLLPDYNEAYSLAEENYNIIMDADNESTEFLKDYMEALGLNEAEYIERSAQANCILMAKSNLYKNFISGKNGSDEELKAAFELYVDELVLNADIEYR